MKKSKLQQLADSILIAGIIISAIGTVYIAVLYHNYGVSACIALSTLHMVSLLHQNKNRKK